MNNIKLLYIDLFCGAGGTTTGVEQAELNGQACAKVIACVNHDVNAIASHQANHPDTLHFTEDIRTLDLTELTIHLNRMRVKYPNALVVLWASLECTNFSKAKGGRPRDADSRTLAEHLFRYIEQLDPDYIQIENVEEFMSWGDMDEEGHPISRLKGRSYVRWCNRIMSYGYRYDWRLLNAADFGAYTSRKRFFGQFARTGLPIAFPIPTYSKEGDNGMFHIYKKWKPVREVLDMNDAGQSIFDRKKPLCEKTLKRIYAGLIKFVAGGKETFLVKYNSMNQTGKYAVPGIDEPCPAVLTTPKQKVVDCFLMNPQFNSAGGDTNKPCFTLIARMDKMPPYLISTEKGLGIRIFEKDSEMTCKIKEFMAMYGIIDIKMRMLNINELKRIMGFPDNYILVGTQAEQKKYIGNAVEVNMSRVLCESLCAALVSKAIAI